MTPDPAIATAADYADALMTARRTKNLLLLLVLLFLLVELAVFFVARYTNVIISDSPAVTVPVSSTQEARVSMADVAQYATGLAIFLGLAFSIMLSMVVYLIVNIMLVGRLIGVARVTSAFVWSLLLLVLLFPWQAFLSDASFSNPSFKIPGVLYTWSELLANARFKGEVSAEAVLKWFRFVVFPVAAIVILLMIQVKSNRGLKQALGEDVVHDELAPPPPPTT
jgi:hypothetical protein